MHLGGVGLTQLARQQTAGTGVFLTLYIPCFSCGASSSPGSKQPLPGMLVVSCQLRGSSGNSDAVVEWIPKEMLVPFPQ